MSNIKVCLFQQKQLSVDDYASLKQTKSAPIIQQNECTAILFHNKKGYYLYGIASTFEILQCLQDYESSLISIKIEFNHAIIEIPRHYFIVSGLKSLANYGIDIDEKYAEPLSKYYLSIINKMNLHVTNAPLGFVSKSNQLLFYGYDSKSSPELKAKSTKGYIRKLNALLENAAGC